MIFKNEDSFTEQERLILKIILTGVTIHDIITLLPQHSEKIMQLADRIKSEMCNPEEGLEEKLFEYSDVVRQKHFTVARGKFEEAAMLRNQERNYLSIGYELLFSDHFAPKQQHIRFDSTTLIGELNRELSASSKE